MPPATPESIFSRRTALRVGLTGTAALVAGGAGAAMGARPLSAAPWSSPRFDLAADSHELFRSKLLAESHRGMQSFAFDNRNRRLFVAQVQNGSSGDDLCINQLSFTGARLGHMHLSGAGHGVSIGVEQVGTSSYIWTECDADRSDNDGRGTALARFKYVSGAKPSMSKHLRGSKGITCAADPLDRNLVVRRKESGSMWFSVYDQAAAARGDFSSRIAHVRQPDAVTTDPRTKAYLDFQGYAVYGRYAYCLAGRRHNSPAAIDSHITCVDLVTGAVLQQKITRAGLSLPNREPEGMGVYRTTGGQARLFLGLASHPSGSPNRYASLYYKNVLVR